MRSSNIFSLSSNQPHPQGEKSECPFSQSEKHQLIKQQVHAIAAYICVCVSLPTFGSLAKSVQYSALHGATIMRESNKSLSLSLSNANWESLIERRLSLQSSSQSRPRETFIGRPTLSLSLRLVIDVVIDGRCCGKSPTEEKERNFRGNQRFLYYPMVTKGAIKNYQPINFVFYGAELECFLNVVGRVNIFYFSC